LEWYYILVIVIAVAIVLFVPTLVWVAVISGLYQVARERLRHRATATRKKAVTAEESVINKVT
jgi:hypothetical protein